MYTGLHVKWPLFLPDFNKKNLEISRNISKRSSKYEIVRKSVLWEPPSCMRTVITESDDSLSQLRERP